MDILIYNRGEIKNPDAVGAEVFTYGTARRWIKKGRTWFTSSFSGYKKGETIDGIRIIREGWGLIVTEANAMRKSAI